MVLVKEVDRKLLNPLYVDNKEIEGNCIQHKEKGLPTPGDPFFNATDPGLLLTSVVLFLYKYIVII